eukprot:5987202-Amphidinium_carterae.1
MTKIKQPRPGAERKTAKLEGRDNASFTPHGTVQSRGTIEPRTHAGLEGVSVWRASLPHAESIHPHPTYHTGNIAEARLHGEKLES